MEIADELARIARGEVLSDEFDRVCFSVDASHYQLTPKVVVSPRDEDDLSQVCAACAMRNESLTARGAGTGLLGQCLGNGVVLDFTSHMNKIIEISENLVRVQPGVVKSVLDSELIKSGKVLPPDPASSKYCTVGGMVANNSSGIHSLQYGSTIDFIEEVKVVYADGSTGFAGPDKWDEKMKKLGELLEPRRDWIIGRFPSVRKNSCGYRLDAVIRNRFCPQKVLAASEGTIALVTEVTFRLMNAPTHASLVVMAFEDILAAASSIPKLLQFNPSALEILDHTATDPRGWTSKPQQSREGGCLVYAEFSGDRLHQAEGSARMCIDAISETGFVVEESADRVSISRIWQARKAALNNIMKMTVGSRKPVGLIEDTVVHPGYLAVHIFQILELYRTFGFKYAIYGHAGDGNIHTRPLVNIDSASEVEAMEKIAGTLFASVVHEKGTITGEHGDGLGRIGYIESVYGYEMLSQFRVVKEIFDPQYLLNPGKKITSATPEKVKKNQDKIGEGRL